MKFTYSESTKEMGKGSGATAFWNSIQSCKTQCIFPHLTRKSFKVVNVTSLKYMDIGKMQDQFLVCQGRFDEVVDPLDMQQHEIYNVCIYLIV